MAHPQYRVLCADLVGTGNQIREELPISDLQFSYILNAAGTFSGTISLDHPKCTRDNLDPGATAIYIERGGQLVWGGILWSAQVDTAERKLHLAGEGFWSYFKRRVIKNRIGMTNVTASASNTYRPNADVVNTGIAGTPDAVNFWNDLKNTTVNTLIGVLSNTPGARMNYRARYTVAGGEFSGLVPGGIRVVMTCASSNNLAINPVLTISGTDYFGQPVAMTPGGVRTVSYTWSLNPATGVAWTSAEVESFGSTNSAGFVTDFCVTAADMAVYQLWMEISWGTSGTAVFLNADELGVARDIINNAQVQPGGNLGITVGSELTTDNGGIFRGVTQTYHSYDRKGTATAVEDLAAAVNGFDFSVEVAWDTTGTIPQKTFKLYYPKRGRRIDGLVFNDNILGVSKVGVDVDATIAANSVDIIGTGDGDNMLIASAADTSLLTRYPLYEAVFSAKDVTDQSLLQAQATATLARKKAPLENPSIEKQANQWPDFGSFQLGDEALVVTSDGWIRINSFQQIQQLTITVGDEGQETMTPVFVSADGTVA